MVEANPPATGAAEGEETAQVYADSSAKDFFTIE